MIRDMPIRFVRAERPFTVSIEGATFKLQRPPAEKRFQIMAAAQASGCAAPGTAFLYALLEESIIEWAGVFDVLAGELIAYDRTAVRDLPLRITQHLFACLSDDAQELPSHGLA